MSVKVSIIIPVYNEEKALPSCIESLLQQTLEACEFIFVNDGSTDQSRQVIEQYQTLDSRIRCLNQANLGVSAARNAGIMAAAGEYIGFVDADDRVEPLMYATMYEAAIYHRCDAVICNMAMELEGHKLVMRYDFPAHIVLDHAFIQETLMPFFLSSDRLNSVCNKIYRRELLERHCLRFPDQIALGEDGWFNIQFFRYAATVQYIDYTGYHYNEVEGSATRDMAHKDYFSRALQVYQLEYSDTFTLSEEEMTRLKSIKLVQSVIDYIHMYARPNRGMSLPRRYRYVKQMIRHPAVRQALPYYCNHQQNSLGRYHRMFLYWLWRSSAVGCYCMTTYSRIRAGTTKRRNLNANH